MVARMTEAKPSRLRIEFSTFGIAMIPLMVGINIVSSYLAAGTPIWADTLGSMLAGIIMGPINGLVVGALTNIFKWVTFDPFALPYAIVNAAIGLIAGICALLGLVRKETNASQVGRILIISIVLAVVATLTSTPLNVSLWGGSTGKPWVDAIFAGFMAGGWQVFPASMAAEFISDITDKVITFFIAWLIYTRVPAQFIKTMRR
jgi:energy-coupling factor transport system substrate-specific component